MDKCWLSFACYSFLPSADKTFISLRVLSVFTTTGCDGLMCPSSVLALFCCACSLELSAHLSCTLNQSWVRSLNRCPSDFCLQGHSLLVTNHLYWVKCRRASWSYSPPGTAQTPHHFRQQLISAMRS